ncbi:hypothetical protein GCK32_020481, partial [Trichostrongylus colubriformis]
MTSMSSKCLDGMPPSPRSSQTPRSAGKSRITRLPLSPKSDNELCGTPQSLRTPGRDGDGKYLDMPQ